MFSRHKVEKMGNPRAVVAQSLPDYDPSPSYAPEQSAFAASSSSYAPEQSAYAASNDPPTTSHALLHIPQGDRVLPHRLHLPNRVHPLPLFYVSVHMDNRFSNRSAIPQIMLLYGPANTYPIIGTVRFRASTTSDITIWHHPSSSAPPTPTPASHPSPPKSSSPRPAP